METLPIVVIELIPAIEAPHELLDDLCAFFGGKLERVCNYFCRRRSHVPTLRCTPSLDNMANELSPAVSTRSEPRRADHHVNP